MVKAKSTRCDWGRWISRSFLNGKTKSEKRKEKRMWLTFTAGQEFDDGDGQRGAVAFQAEGGRFGHRLAARSVQRPRAGVQRQRAAR